MMMIIIEKIGYYLSCMSLFNAIYVLRSLEEGLLGKQHANWESWQFIVDFITFCLAGIMLALGVVFTVLIVHRDDSIKRPSTLGKSITVKDLVDLTCDNYFFNFSLLVLTALALPMLHHLYSLALYLCFFAALGIVHVNKNLIYINPVLTMFNFSTYRCKDAKTAQTYMLVARDYVVRENETVHFQNTASTLIRLSNGQSSKEEHADDTGN